MECFQKNLEQEGRPVILMECRILKLKKKKCFPMAQIQMTQIVEMIPSKQPETVNGGTGGTDADLHNHRVVTNLYNTAQRWLNDVV